MKNERRVRAGMGYITRPLATELIAKKKGLTDKDPDFHQIYRQFGRDMREGKIPVEPIGGGRIMRIAEKDLYEYAKKYHMVELEELRSSCRKEDELSFEVVENIESIIKLADQGILSKEQAFDALRNALKK